MFLFSKDNIQGGILKLSICFCLLYGSLWLSLVSGAGDGTWFLYVDEIFSGLPLYKELHVTQQPIFFLISAFVRWVAGDNYLLLKILYLPLLIFFIYSIYKISSLCSKNEILRSLIVLFIFFSGTLFEAYRFDDYHVFAHSLVLISFYYSSLYITNKVSFENFSLIQSFIFGLAFLTRINEGLCIFFAILFISIVKRPSVLKLIKSFIYGTVIFIVLVILALTLMHDTPLEWLSSTLFQATESKGGVVLIGRPINLILNSYNFLADYNTKYLIKIQFLSIIFLFLWIFYFHKKNDFNIRNYYWFSIAIFIIYSIKRIYNPILSYDLIPICLFIALGLFIYSLFFLCSRFINKPAEMEHSSQLYLAAYPFFLFALSSLSSGGRFDSLFFPSCLALICLIIFISSIYRHQPAVLPILFIAYMICFTSVIEGVSLRSKRPYGWQSYYAPKFFSGFKGYEIINDSARGLHIMPIELMNLISPVCEIVGKNHTLLSLPFSFANYYCGVKPWNGYIQTFFDTSNSKTIRQLIAALENSPPDYIFYQRQLINMTAHENIFFGDKPLPHRDLDRLIMNRIAIKKWKIVYQSDSYPPSEWMLIKTDSK